MALPTSLPRFLRQWARRSNRCPTPPACRPARARLRLEALEVRELLSVVPGTNFPGMNFSDSGGFTPPDTIAAAGPTKVVEAVNSTVAFYDKGTGAKLFQQSLNGFFASVGPASSLFDPTVAYDEQAGRFVITADEQNSGSQTAFINFAVSNTSDPTAGFTEMHRVEVDETNGAGQKLWGDQPKFGRNADAYVISFNMFAFSGSYDHVQTLAIDKPSVLDQNNATLTTFKKDWAAGRFSVVPATMHDSVAGGPMWFVDSASFSSVRVSRVDNVLSNSPPNTDFVLSVSSYSNPPTAAQPGTTNQIDAGDRRTQSVAFRGNRLLAAQEVGTGGVAHARWYEFNTGVNPPTLTQSGEINPGAGIYTYFPSIDIATNGDLGMTYMESSASEFMSTYVTGRKNTDPLGTMQTPALAKAGEATYHPFDSPPYRAGDYSGISVDPSTGTSFWAANEYARAVSGTNWATWATNFSIINGTNLTVNGTAGDDTITVHNQTGNPANAEVIVNGTSVFTGAWSGLGSITIAASSGNDTVNIENDASGVPITVNLGNGTDTVNLSPTAHNLGNILSSVAVNGGGGVDTLNVNDQATATAQSWAVAANSVTRGGAGPVSYGGLSNLVVNGGGGNNTYTVSGTAASLGTTLNTGAGTDTTNVQGTAAALTVNAQGGGGNDVVNVGLNNSLSGVNGALTINNAAAASHVNVNDTADGASHAGVALSAGGLTGLAPAAINFGAGAVNVLTINAGNGNNAYTVADAPASGGTTLNTGAGTDTVNVQGASNPVTVNSASGSGADAFTLGSAANLLSGITAAVTVTAAATDTLALNDQGFGGARAFTVTATTVSWGPTLTYSGLGALTINGGSGADTFTVSGTSATAALTVAGGSGNNTLVGPNADSTWNVTGSNAGTLVTGSSTTTFSGIKNLTGGSGADAFVVSNGAGVGGVIDGGGGANTLDESAYTTPVTVNLQTGVRNVQSLLGGSGVNTLVGPNAATTWNVTAQNAGNLNSAITFTAFQNLVGGAGNDTFVLSDAVGVDGGIDGGGGANTLNESAYTTPVTVNLQTNSATGVGGTIANLQSFVGSAAGGNTLVGPNAATTWNVTAQNAGTLTGGLSFSGFQNLTGGSAADTFALSNGVGVDGNLDGGGGSNTLNEAAFTTPVTVNLGTGTATGVGGTFANLQAFVGGSGSNTLTGTDADTTWNLSGSNAGTLSGGLSFTAFGNLAGGAGADTFVFANGATVSGSINGGGGTNKLDYSAYTANVIVNLQTSTATGVGGGIANIQNVTGGNGPGGYNILVGNGGNVLVGGNGRRNLLIAGSSASTLIGGNDQDILIAGTTDYDTNLAALLDIMSVWTGSGTYQDRVNRLVNDPTYAFSLNANTVHSNGGGNTLTGKPGGSTALDLYFANLGAGDTTDATGSDTLVGIS